MDKHTILRTWFRPSLSLHWDDLVAVVGESRVVVNANIVAQARDALAARLLQHPGFRIDPVTYRLGENHSWFDTEDGPKASYLKLEQNYGEGLPFKLLGVPLSWRRRSASSRQRFVSNVLSFQRDFLMRERADTLRLFAPGELAEVERGLRPAALLLPYFIVKADDDLRDQIALWEVAPAVYRELQTEGIVALHTSALDNVGLLAQLADALDSAQFRTTWLWVPGFRPNATRIGEQRVRNLKAFVQRLAPNRRQRILHGGFLEMLLSFDGVEEVACDAQIGVAGIRAKSGGYTVAQYYATAVHSLVSYELARHVVSNCYTRSDLAQELCPCVLCGRAWERFGQNGFAAMFLSGEIVEGHERPSIASAAVNRMHTFVARLTEVAYVRASSIESLLADVATPRMLDEQQAKLAWTLRTVS